MSEADLLIAREMDELVQGRTGLCMKALSRDTSEQRLHAAMKRAGIRNAWRFVQSLRTNRQAFDDLIGAITVPETYFFRDAEQFEFLRMKVVPAFLGLDRTIRVWSAGCATGEEAYSLAVLLAEQGLSRRARVLGTDISQRALARARRAEYGLWSLRGVPAEVVSAHFCKVDEKFELAPRIKEMVSFHYHNLASDEPPPMFGGPGEFDLITCKNVFIYLKREITQRVARMLASRLHPSGWLLTGPSDPLLEVADLCETFATPFGLCYQRRTRADRRASRSLGPAAPRFESLLKSAAPRAASPLQSEPKDAPKLSLLPRPGVSSSLPLPSSSDLLAEPQALTEHEAVELVRTMANQEGTLPAVRFCTAQLLRHPMSAGLHYMHAILLLDLRRELEADMALKRVLYLDATLPVAHFMRGVLASRRRDDAACLRAFLCCQAHCEGRDPESLASFGDGISHAALREAARDAVRRMVDSRGVS